MFYGDIIDGESRNVKLEAALDYASRGYYLIALHNPQRNRSCSCGDPNCNHIGKHPRIVDGEDGCTIDKDIIRNWWKEWSDANIGIVLGKSGLVAIDIEWNSGGSESLKSLETIGDLGHHLTYYIGDGQQFIYRNNGMSFKKAQNILPGINIKAVGQRTRI